MTKEWDMQRQPVKAGLAPAKLHAAAEGPERPVARDIEVLAPRVASGNKKGLARAFVAGWFLLDRVRACGEDARA